MIQYDGSSKVEANQKVSIGTENTTEHTKENKMEENTTKHMVSNSCKITDERNYSSSYSTSLI